MSDEPEYYKWSWFVDDDYERKMFLLGHTLDSLTKEILWTDAPVRAWPDDVTFEVEGEAPEDVPFNAVGWTLFSARLKTLVESVGLTGITFHPVQLVSEIAVPVPRYWYVHFAHVHEAIDMERSTYSYFDLSKVGRGRVLNMVKYVLNRHVIEGWDLFRVAEKPSAIFCSERFRRLFVENGCTGLGFDNIPVT